MRLSLCFLQRAVRLFVLPFSLPRVPGVGNFVLDCDAAFYVDESAVVLSSPLTLNAVVTCNGTHVLTAADVDNLERQSEGITSAVDEYNTEVSAEAAVVVTFEQVTGKLIGHRKREGAEVP